MRPVASRGFLPALLHRARAERCLGRLAEAIATILQPQPPSKPFKIFQTGCFSSLRSLYFQLFLPRHSSLFFCVILFKFHNYCLFLMSNPSHRICAHAFIPFCYPPPPSIQELLEGDGPDPGRRIGNQRRTNRGCNG